MVAPEKERNYQNNRNNNYCCNETTDNMDLTLIAGHYAPGF